MAAGVRHHRMLLTVGTLAVMVALAIPAAVQAAETPRRGGILLAAIGADAPSLDPHQESTFATLQMVAPLYSTLIQVDPLSYPKIIGDAASEWKIAPDGLTYTFKIRPGIKFHDGSPLTAVDVKATYDKLLSPRRDAQRPEEQLLSGHDRRGPRREHRRVQAQVPVGVAAPESGLALERDLSEEVPRQGS